MPAVHALLLSDGRFPWGGHAHSGGLEAAVAAELVGDLASVEQFLRGRLATAGLAAAGLAAAACCGVHPWEALDAEADARVASPALRLVSRRQGRQLLRAAVAVWGGPVLAGLAAAIPSGPHHPVAVGAGAAAAGLGPADAARAAAYESVTGPAAAAVRLLGLDPFAVHALLARLAPAVEAATDHGVAGAAGPLDGLPCPAAPLLDVLAERHARLEARLFAS